MRLTLSYPLLLLASFVTTMAAASYRSCFDGTSRFVEEDWDFCQEIQPDLFMYYKPFPEEGNVMLGLHATQDTFGWTALALAGNGGMKGASQIVVRQDQDGEWIAEDRNSQDYVMPALDESQDVKLLFANQTICGETSWGVLIPMSSCDVNDYPIEDISVFMHWAFGNDHTFGFHGERRGQFHANLMRAPKELPSTDGLPYVDFLMPDVAVELGEGGADPTNPYICSYFDLTQLPKMNIDEDLGPDAKVHVTRLVPVLNEESKPYVHHMILYACEGGADDEPSSDESGDFVAAEHLNIIPECESMPRGCNIMKWPWAVGSEEIILPDNVGLPFGGQESMLVLQMHYYNPNLHENVRDSSGVRVYFTTDFREEEAGVMTFNGGTGGWQREDIPAGESDYTLSPMVIPSSCTGYNWAQPLTILGLVHHMHLSGKKMELNIERDGRSLGPLRHEKYYDFNHQSLEHSAIGEIRPGDQIVMNCHYDTTGRDEDIEFGDLTQQEMCYAAMLYYPIQSQQGFSYAPIRFNTTSCVTAGAGLYGDYSDCAESYMDNVPKFLQWRRFMDEPFGALQMCNSDFYESMLLPFLPGSCPDCYQHKNCTEEEVAAHAQNEVCRNECNDHGVSVYPNMSLTEAYTMGTFGCSPHGPIPEGGWDVQYMQALEMQEQPTCVPNGNMEQVVELAEGINASTIVECPVSGSSKVQFGSALAGLVVVVLALVYP